MTMDPNRLRELIEARHPDAADWDAAHHGLDPAEARLLEEALQADPALAVELARVEAWDVELGQAFEDVEVPAGLAERLLAATQSPPLLVAVTPEAIAPAVPVAGESERARSSSLPSRRALLGALVGLAATVALAVGVATWSLSPRKLALEPLLEESRLACEDSSETDWKSDWKSAQLAEHRFDTSALVVAPLRWRQHATSVGTGAAVIYDLTGPRRKAARLMVYHVPNAQGDLASFPSRVPETTTGGYSIGAWQRGDLVYVLVVEGNAARYGTFVRELTTG